MNHLDDNYPSFVNEESENDEQEEEEAKAGVQRLDNAIQREISGRNNNNQEERKLSRPTMIPIEGRTKGIGQEEDNRVSGNFEDEENDEAIDDLENID
jgi:2-oxo-4-hydroxy-4-carboxy--5-ureidoimidazoline (OHCU) decarboxylase